MKSFLRLLRPVNCLMASVAVLIGSYLGGIPGALLPTLLAMASAFLISAEGMVVNDYYDKELDFIYDHDKPLPSGKVSPRQALILTFTFFSIGLYLAFWINLKALLLVSLNSLLLVLYAKELQKRFFISNLIISFLVGSTFLLGGLSVGNYFPALLLGGIAFFANTAREIVKDIEDKSADITKDIKSVPIVLGEDRSRMISSVMVLIAIAISPLPLIFNVFNLRYILFVIPSISVFLYSIYLAEEGEDPSRIQNMHKLGMILGLIAFLGGAF